MKIKSHTRSILQGSTLLLGAHKAVLLSTKLPPVPTTHPTKDLDYLANHGVADHITMIKQVLKNDTMISERA